MDKYDAAHDHYCYLGSGVLKNKLNIQDMEELELAERDITAIKIQQIHFSKPPYSQQYMQHLHRVLFCDLYEWAGEIRNVDISKGNTRFCNWTRIVPESNKLFVALEQANWLNGHSLGNFCEQLAEFYCEFNMVHPFREGNGRVQRLLFEHLTLSAGYQLSWTDVTRNEWLQANIDGVQVDYQGMTNIFKRIVQVL